MNKIQQKIKKQWERNQVKFEVIKDKPVWKKTLRSVHCSICGKYEVEKEFDEGFDRWKWVDLMGTDGKYAEVCPECSKIFLLPFMPCRRLECKRCGIVQKEKIRGIGFPGWFNPTLLGDKNRELMKGFCPNCFLNYLAPKMPKFITGTYTALTFASNSLLTSTKMTQFFANLAALAAREQNSPAFIHLVNNAYLDGATWKSKASGACSMWQTLTNKSSYYYYFASAANETISWSEKFKIDEQGLIQIGNIRDSGITTTQIASGVTTPIFAMFSGEKETADYAVWEDVYQGYVNIRNDSVKIFYYLRTGGPVYTAYARAIIGGQTSTGVSTKSTSFTWLDETLNISAESGQTLVEVQIKISDVVKAHIDGCSIYITA